MPTKSALIVYATARGRTKKVVERLAQQLGEQMMVSVGEIKEVDLQTLHTYDLVVAGSPTYGIGDLHPAWQSVNASIECLRLNHVLVALFALGDQRYHGQTFGGSLKHLDAIFAQTGAVRIGQTRCEGYQFAHCPALAADGTLPGLLLDEISQRRSSPQRIEQWVQKLFEEAGVV